MYGFIITKNCEYSGKTLGTPQKLSYNEVHFYNYPLPKFDQDRLFYEDEEKIVLLDGVILNKAELLLAYQQDSWRGTFDVLWDLKIEEKIGELRGSFCGVIFEKATESLFCFVNQTGEKPIYYVQSADVTVVASHNNILTDMLKQLHICVEPDLLSCRELIATGSILHGKTPFCGVRRLMAGKYLYIKDGQQEECRYHMFCNIPEHKETLEECVVEMDKRFRKAVDRIFAKNAEYGYDSEGDLSGGLDSRMVAWVAHDLGYRNILNICYSQSKAIDHTTSRKIAQDLGNEYLFLPLDGGSYLMDIDDRVNLFGGQSTFISSSGAYRAMEQIKARNIGLCATGLLGEIHNAYWTEGLEHTPAKYIVNRYSAIVPFLAEEEYSTEYNNYEQMNLYEYSFPLFMSSAIMRHQSCEVASPFADVDFLEYAFKIPLKWRKGYLLTKTWMVTKYPEAAKYVWQTERMPVDKSYYQKIYWPKIVEQVCIFPIRVFNKLTRMMHLPFKVTLKRDMLAFDYWYQKNPELRAFINCYFSENIYKIADKSLREICNKTFVQGDIRDKLQAINLLAVYKKYF